jgi:hypothetical protein
MRKRDGRGTIYISEKVEKLLFCLSVKSAVEFASGTVYVQFVGMGFIVKNDS